MLITEKIYVGLCSLFSILIIVGNLTYQKFVSLNFLSFYHFQLSVGAILYPVTFLITDLIAEFFGKERTNFCVKVALTLNILVAFIIMIMDALPATSWSKISDQAFHNIFGFYLVAFLGSIIACYLAQTIDVIIYLWIRNKTKNKHLWLRNNLSTAVSLLIDTCIVIIFLTIFEILSKEQMYALIFNSYIWKLFFTICSTPLFYGCVSITNIMIKRTS
ncbi:MAG: queuosine precursor transporter [Rickettsiales endosymbiont of Dermacentor nuttalli]